MGGPSLTRDATPAASRYDGVEGDEGHEGSSSGLKKSDLLKNRSGKIVSKKSHAAGKKAYKHIKGWTVAVTKAKKDLGLTGFVAVKKGTPLYKAAKAIYSI